MRFFIKIRKIMEFYDFSQKLRKIKNPKNAENRRTSKIDIFRNIEKEENREIYKIH